MANYTSQLLARRKPQEPIDTQAVGFVLASKEQKWNANQAKLDETLSKIGSVQLLREKDKEHLLNNVEILLGNISNPGDLDLSSNTVARGLENTILSAIDDYTVDQVINTKKITSFNQTVGKIKEEDPEKYNPINHEDALVKSGYFNYMEGKTDKIGNLSYTPYVDYGPQIDKSIQDNLKAIGIEKTTLETGEDGYVYSVTREVVEPERIQNIIQGSMTPQMEQQMMIEADYYSRRMSEGQRQVVSDSWTKNLEDSLSQARSTAERMKVQITNNKGTAKEAQLTTALQQQNEYIERLESGKTDRRPFEAKYRDTYLNNFLDQKKAQYVTNKVTDMEIDSNWIRMMELEEKRAKRLQDAQESYFTATSTGFTDNVVDFGTTDLTEFPEQVSQIEGEFTNSFQNYNAMVDKAVQSGQIPEMNYAKYSKLSDDDKRKYNEEILNTITNGQDIKNVYPQDLVNAAKNYKMSRQNLDAVVKPIEATVEEMFSTLYKGLAKSYRDGTFDAQNFEVGILAESVIQGADINDLRGLPNVYNQAKIELIDQILREDLQGNSVNERMLRTYRDRLISSLPKNVRDGIAPTDIVGQSATSNFFGAVGQASMAGLKSVSNMLGNIFGAGTTQQDIQNLQESKNRASQMLSEMFKESSGLKELGDVVHSVSTLGLANQDRQLRDLDANIFERDFYIGDQPTNVSSYVNGMMSTVSAVNQEIAGARVKHLQSTNAVVLNANLVGKESQPEVNAAKSLMASLSQKTGVPSTEMDGSNIAFSYDETTGVARIFANSKEGDRIESDFKLQELPTEVQGQLVTTIEERAYNAVDNISAQPHIYHNTLFNNDGDKMELLNKLYSTREISTELYQLYKQNFDSIGYDSEEFLLNAQNATNKEGTSLMEKYPKAVENIMTGKYRFRAEYSPVLGEGYFLDTYFEDTETNKKQPLTSAQPIAEYVDPSFAKLDALSRQNEIMKTIINGYENDNKQVLKLLQSLNR